MAKKRSKNKNTVSGSEIGNSGNNPGLLIYVPALCSVIGTLMLLVVIAATIPLTVPNFMGYEIFNVVSGSMEPTIPVGSIIYVKEIDPVEVESGDIIAFQSGDSVIMHRVVDNKMVEGAFTTKGDANNGEDMNDVPYDNLIGIVVKHIPILGQLLILFGSTFGRVCMVCFAACGAVLNILGGRFRDAIEYERKEDLERERLLAEAMRKKQEQEQKQQ